MRLCFRSIFWPACLAALGLLAQGKAAGQVMQEIHFQPISLFDTTLFQRPYGEGTYLASVLPVLINRPIDDISPRAGAQAMAMGGAHLALADGALAMAWNPAGMAGLRQTSVCVDGFSRGSSGKGSGLPDSLLIPGYGDFSISTYSNRLGSVSGFGFFGAARPLLDLGGAPLVGGVSYRRHTDVAYGQEMLMEMRLLAATAGFPFKLGIENEERGFIESLTFGLGYEAIHSPAFSLAVGSTGNFLTGRLRSDNLARVDVRNFEEGQGKFQQNYSGFSLEAGATAELTSIPGVERLRLAAWAGLPHRIKVDNGRLVDQPISSPDAQYVYRSYWDIADYDMEIPLFASVGMALGPIRGVEIAADYNLRPWSEVEIRHRAPAFRQFDCTYPAADANSFHVGARFEFPLLRQRLHAMGLRLNMMAGYRTLPLALYDTDLPSPDDETPTVAPYYRGDPVEGDATSLGFSLETGQVSFHLGLEFQSYDYHTWFLNDQSELGTRENPLRAPWFSDPYDRVIKISRDNTVLRFSSEMRL